MISLAILSVLPVLAMGETGTLTAGRPAESYVVCGERRTGADGPELVNADGEVVVPTAYEREVERQMRKPAKDGAWYCVSFRRSLGIVHAEGISQLSCSGMPATWAAMKPSGGFEKH